MCHAVLPHGRLYEGTKLAWFAVLGLVCVRLTAPSLRVCCMLHMRTQACASKLKAAWCQ